MRRAFGLLLLAVCPLLHAQDYAAAEAAAGRFEGKLLRANVSARWLEGGKKFWYTVTCAPGWREFITVDTRTGVRTPAFFDYTIGPIVANILNHSYAPTTDPITILDFDDKSVKLSLLGKRWRYDRATQKAEEIPADVTKEAVDSLPAFLPAVPSGSGEAGQITVLNRTASTVDVYWMNGEGRRVKYASVLPGRYWIQNTYEGHVWLLTNSEGAPLAAYRATEGQCSAVWDGTPPPPPPVPRPYGLSPDGKWTVDFQTDDLWLVPTVSTERVRLSKDGKPGNAYDGRLWWSPDSRYLAALRVEAGGDRRLVIKRPGKRTIDIPYAKPGDKIAHPRLIIFDLQTHRVVSAEETLAPNPWSLDNFQWSADSKEIRYVYNQRGHQVERLLAANAATGKVRTIAEERSKTFIDYSQKTTLQYLDHSDQALWASERSGFNHLYLVDLGTGKTTPVTKGPWVMRSVEKVDEPHRQVTLRVMGIDPKQDPYQMHYIRVGFDGGALTRLTEGDGTHRITESPDGETYLDVYSRVDLAPVTELHARDGHRIALLEKGDASALKKEGWATPERFVAKARDGKTDIWGVIYRPTNFNPAKRYPVIENIYAGPHDFFVPKSFATTWGDMKLTELGFVVVHIDGMGTNWRSKAFHDVAYQNLADAGFPDRILWMKAAQKARPWMDLSRVGVFGTSAGGQSAASAVMRFGNFYRAAVADCGCHDNRVDKIWWNEAWMGWPIGPSYAANSNVTAAKHLKGKLYLMVGDVDTNVDPISTQQVVDALKAAGKPYELMVVPDAGHGVLGLPGPYRAMQEFFVRNLKP